MTWFGIKWPEKGWYAVKQNNQLTNPLKFISVLYLMNWFHNEKYVEMDFLSLEDRGIAPKEVVFV